MRRLGFGLGRVVLLVGLASGVATLLALVVTGGPGAVSIGSLWYAVHANSLVGFQGLVERTIGPPAWTPLQALIVAPAWLTLGLPGALLCLLLRPRRGRFD